MKIAMLEHGRQMADLSTSLASVASRVETGLVIELPREVKAVMKPISDNIYHEYSKQLWLIPMQWLYQPHPL